MKKLIPAAVGLVIGAVAVAIGAGSAEAAEAGRAVVLGRAYFGRA